MQNSNFKIKNSGLAAIPLAGRGLQAVSRRRTVGLNIGSGRSEMYPAKRPEGRAPARTAFSSAFTFLIFHF
jgi:hypothetical protein